MNGSCCQWGGVTTTQTSQLAIPAQLVQVAAVWFISIINQTVIT